MVPLNIPCFIFELKNPARFNEGDGAYSHRNETDLQTRQRSVHLSLSSHGVGSDCSG